MTDRLIAIGDIHGCAAALDALLGAVAPQRSDVVVTLGDYVDRGSDSRQVIDRLLKLETECKLIPLLGNHEIMLLQAVRSPGAASIWRQCGGDATLASYDGSLLNMPVPHHEFFARCVRHFETDKHFFVHANYHSQLPLDQQPDDLLFWTHLHLRPPKPHISGKTAVVGHTPQRGCCVLRLDHLIALDTGCYGGGVLSAMDLGSGEIWQADSRGQLIPPDEVLATHSRKKPASTWRKWFSRRTPAPHMDG